MLSDHAKDLITKILVTESDKRMEYEDILAHEWFTENEEIKDEETKDNTSTQSLKENFSSNLALDKQNFAQNDEKSAWVTIAPSKNLEAHIIE